MATPTRAVLNHAACCGWCETPQFERAKPAGKRTDWFTPAEAETMIPDSTAHLRPLWTFLFRIGARLGEALALIWAHVDLDHARATLRGTKNGDERTLDLVPRAVAALAAIRRAGRWWPRRAAKQRSQFPRCAAASGHAPGAAEIEVRYGGDSKAIVEVTVRINATVAMARFISR
jgi:integrase